MAEPKAKCDSCGKMVGPDTLYKRVGFVAGSRLNAVCHACYADKLNRDERIRFAKPATRRKPAPVAEDRPDPNRPPDELRFGG